MKELQTLLLQTEARKPKGRRDLRSGRSRGLRLQNRGESGMSIETRWIVSQSASCFRAAEILRRGRSLANRELAKAIAEPVERLRSEVLVLGLDEEQFWSHLLPQSARIENNRQLADVVLKKSLASAARAEVAVDRLAGRIADVEAAVRRVLPALVEDLTAASPAMRDAWETVGQGVLEDVGRLTDERLIVSSAEVNLVYPASGGGGMTHLPYNSVTIEVVAADPHADLPESVRLAWMLSQLNVDLPIFSENMRPDRRAGIAALAMLPPTLVAAEEMELVCYSPQTVASAIDAWGIERPETGRRQADGSGSDASKDSALAEVVQQWWETYLDSRPAWTVALVALDHMVP